MIKKYFIYYGILLVWVLLQSCHAVKKNYHDTCLHYNKYFIANEKMKEIEMDLWKSHKDDYNSVLRVYPDCDSNMSKTIKAQGEECMKKASLGIDWHGGTYWSKDSWNGESRWADNAFILIGKTRLYLNDFKNARETFKYVNTKTKNDNDRHEALIWLANTYTKSDDYFAAAEVFTQLSEEKLNKRNKREYYIAKTYFHTKVGEFAHANKYVQKAIPLTSRWVYKRDKRARLHFIAAQIYQMYNRDSSAYINYQKTIKNNPPYELGFYARLYAAQVSDVASEKQGKKIQKYFKKMLKDPKNKEYNDKIYYEMANYELKYKNYAKATGYLEKSLKTEISNPVQKGYSYLKLGELNYEHYKNYKKAKLYYDSALTTLPQTHKDYKKIAKRKNILDEFAKYYDIIVLEDSLQKIAKLDTAAISRKLDALIEEDYKNQKVEFLAQKRAEKQKAEREAKAKELAQSTASVLNNDPNAKWYFYNYATVQSGKTDFKKLWGNRVLEDHWRRSTKEKVEPNPEELQEDSATQKNNELVNVDPNAPKPDKDGFLGKKLDKQELYKNIPLTPKMLETSNQNMADAMFHLGKIYQFKLEETDNAVDTYLGMNKRLPGNDHEPDALYLLYLIYKDKDPEKAEYYKNLLLTNHPNNEFAKGLIDPNWREKENLVYKKYLGQYQSVFRLYEAKAYGQADTLAQVTVKENPETPFKGKLELISVLVKARTKDVYTYRASLLEFDKNNKDSTLKEYTTILIKQCEDRIKLKEEIEKKWKVKLDSMEQAKNAPKPSESNIQNTTPNKPQVQNDPNTPQDNPVVPVQQGVDPNIQNNTPTDQVNPAGNPVQQAEEKPVEGGTPDQTVIKKEEKEKLNLPEEQMGADPTLIPPK